MPDNSYKARFMNIFKKLTDRFHPSIQSIRVGDYYEMVKNHSISEIQLAVDEWLKSNNRMPTPVEFMDLVQIQFSQGQKEYYDTSWEDVKNAPVDTPLANELRNLLFEWAKRLNTKNPIPSDELLKREKELCEKYNYQEPELPERIEPMRVLYQNNIELDMFKRAMKKKLHDRNAEDKDILIKARDELAKFGYFVGLNKFKSVFLKLHYSVWQDIYRNEL